MSSQSSTLQLASSPGQVIPTRLSASRSFRALATIPCVTIHYGHFITRTAMRRCVKDRNGKAAYAEVWTTEEKGSDVNLASHP
jgi:hypothetical protein